MKALVTGGTGFVGANVVRVLLSEGHEVRVLARPGGDRRAIDGLEIDITEGDLTDRDSIRDAVKGCQSVFHVGAAYTLWVKDADWMWDVNVEGTRRVMEESIKAGVEKIIHTSSVAAVGLREDPPADEKCIANSAHLIGPYKKSKHAAEELVRKMVETEDLQAVIVNPSTPFGPWDVKPTPTGKIVVDFLNGKMPGFLDTGLNVVDVEDCARGHYLAWEKGTVGERYILGNKNMTLQEILVDLAEVSGLPVPKWRIPYAVAYTAGLGSHLISKLTGKPPSVPLDGVRMAKKRMFFSAEKAVEQLGLPRTEPLVTFGKAVRWFVENGYAPPPPKLQNIPQESANS